MADEPAKPKRRTVKPVETVREKAEKAANKTPKERGVIGLTFHYISLPFRLLGRKLAPLGRFKVVRVIGRILWPTYFRNSWKELRQVKWPTFREAAKLTGAVIIFSAIFGVLIAIVDYGLDKLFKQVLLK